VAAAAVLLAVAIFAWRVSGAAAGLLHAYTVHVSLLAARPRAAPHPVLPACAMLPKLRALGGSAHPVAPRSA
jgi:hypothetical protein